MFAVLAGLVTLFPALIWQLHGNAFAPVWAQNIVLWAWFVVAMSLESSATMIVCALAGVVAWSVLAGVSLPGTTWGFVLMVGVAMVLLRAWLTFRSLWSAFALLFVGHLFFFVEECVGVSWRGELRDYWQAIVGLAGIRIAWGVGAVFIGMRASVWIRRRLRAYIGTGSRFSV